jgi:hypothetical protein
MTPYPSLCSSAASLEFGFHPTITRREEMDVDLTAMIHPRGCTPPPRGQSPGLQGWSNESVSLFGTTPEKGFLSDGRGVEIRSRGCKGVESEGGNGKGSMVSKRRAGSPSGSNNHNGSILLKRGGGKQNWLVGKMRDVFVDWREKERMKRELKIARIKPGDLKGIDLGPFVFAYAKRDKVKV